MTETTQAEAPQLKRRALKFVAFALVVTACVLGIKYTRHHVFPKRFQTIEEGLYRSAQMRRWPYERVIADKGIKTILRLNKKAALADPDWAIEDELVAKNGIKLIHIKMGSGSGIVPFDQLEQAADLANDPSLRPMLFHCAAGDKRSSAVHAVWRMRHCGYTWEQTDKELREYGLRDSATRLFAHLERYYTERVLNAPGKPDPAPVESASKSSK